MSSVAEIPNPMADPESLLGEYNTESRDAYWLKRWDIGDKLCQWKIPERKNGDGALIRDILRGLHIAEQFSESSTNTKSVTESDAFFQKFSKNANVLVPLCGDSRVVSLLWEMGFNVTGCDLSEKALKNVVAELGGDENIHWTILDKSDAEKLGASSAFVGVNKNGARGNKISLFAGDLFNISLTGESNVSKFDLIYDRGSLVALLPEMREKYCTKLRGALRSTKEGSHVSLFSGVESGEKQIVALWLFKRAVRNEKTIGSGPPFHFDVESEIKGKYFNKEFGFERVELVDEPSKEQVENAPNGAFIEVMTNIYRMA